MNESVRLVENEGRFRSLFDNNPDFILFQDADGVILDANPAFLNLVHKQKEQVLGHAFSDFLPADKAPLFEEKLIEAFRGTKVQFEVAVQLVGAEPKVLSVSNVPLLMDGHVAGVHMIARDITAEAEAQAMIQQQARKLNTIFESITDAFFLLDKNWIITSLNTEVERLLGLSRQQLLKHSIWEVFPGEVLASFYQPYQQAMATGQAAHFEAFYEPSQLWLEVKAFPSEEGLSVYFSNVTDKVRASKELYHQNNDLQQFAYLVSHNLRAPLTNILGLVDLLTSLPKSTPDYDQLLRHLHVGAEQLDAVLRDMNTILSVRDKQDLAEPELVPLLEVVEQVVQNLQELLLQCGGEVHCALAPSLSVHGNRAYLYSIFFNLLSNAIKYRSEARPLCVSITATTSTGQPGVHISVADNGSGFDVQKAGSDVFKLYRRFHAQPGGRGLGLYLVKTHVDAMGGCIEVQSEVHVGTRFQIHLF